MALHAFVIFTTPSNLEYTVSQFKLYVTDLQLLHTGCLNFCSTLTKLALFLKAVLLALAGKRRNSGQDEKLLLCFHLTLVSNKKTFVCSQAPVLEDEMQPQLVENNSIKAVGFFEIIKAISRRH